MIRLKNIVKNEDLIQCDYFVENEETKYTAVLNWVTGEMVRSTGPQTYHAMKKLMRLAQLENPPAEAYEVWY